MTSYKSVETMYSTLRCGMRLYQLTTSDFAQCGDEIKQSIQNIGEFVFGLGLRNFLTCKDDFLLKRQAIQEIVLPYSERRFFLTKIAVAMPGAFSILSNLMAMFSPFLLELRRKWKYRHLR